jgi:hypothetical protein
MNLDAATVGGIDRAAGAVGLEVGFGILLAGGFWIRHHHLDEFLAKPASAEGQVAENKRLDNDRRGYRVGTSYLAIVQFTGRNGQTVLHRDWVGLNPPAFYVGSQTTTRVDENLWAELLWETRHAARANASS